MIDLSQIKHVHFTGIKGVAMTALACYLKETGVKVTGSDIDEIFPTDDILERMNINCHIGFSGDFIRKIKPGLLIYTGAHKGRENGEVRQADQLGIPVMPHGQALGYFMKPYRCLSVAGSHGKTTTTAMITTIFKAAGLDPSYAIGCGEVYPAGNPGHAGRGKWFIAEADEYVTDPGHDNTPRFLWQKPAISVVTNIDFDHPDVYGNLEDVYKAFNGFVSRTVKSGYLVVNGDDKLCRLLKFRKRITLGFSSNNLYTIKNVSSGAAGQEFDIFRNKEKTGRFKIKVPGKHNVFDASLAAVVSITAGISTDRVKQGLMNFRGTKRRFQLVYSGGSLKVYDDYAHHPREIEATLTAARQRFGEKSRIISVFQPHTFSRTLKLSDGFARAFTESDIVIISEIYASKRESADSRISGRKLAKLVSGYHKQVFFRKDYELTRKFLIKNIRKNDIIIFMGAGDIYNWSTRFKKFYDESRNSD